MFIFIFVFIYDFLRFIIFLELNFGMEDSEVKLFKSSKQL